MGKTKNNYGNMKTILNVLKKLGEMFSVIVFELLQNKCNNKIVS